MNPNDPRGQKRPRAEDVSTSFSSQRRPVVTGERPLRLVDSDKPSTTHFPPTIPEPRRGSIPAAVAVKRKTELGDEFSERERELLEKERALAQREQELLAALNEGAPGKPYSTYAAVDQPRASSGRAVPVAQETVPVERVQRQAQTSGLRSFDREAQRSRSPPLQPITPPADSDVTVGTKTAGRLQTTSSLEVKVDKLLQELNLRYRQNNLPAMTLLFNDAKRSGIRFPASGYINLLSCLNIYRDEEKMEKLYQELFVERNLPLSLEEYQDVLRVLASSPLKDRALRLYQAAIHKKNLALNDPRVYDALFCCLKNPQEASMLFWDMKKHGVHLAPAHWPQLLRILAADRSQIQPVVDEMKRLGVKFTPILEELAVEEAFRIVESTGLSLDAEFVSRILKETPLEKTQLLYDSLKPSPEGSRLYSAELSEAFLEKALVLKNSDLCLSLWSDWLHAPPATPAGTAVRRPTEEHARKILAVLCQANDPHVLAFFKEARALIRTPDVPLYKGILSVGAHNRLALVAKEVWRDMQSRAIVPDPEALVLILRSCAGDPAAMSEIYDVIHLSRLPLPPDSESLVIETFNQSDDTRRRIPDVKQAFALIRHQAHGLPQPAGVTGASSSSPDAATAAVGHRPGASPPLPSPGAPSQFSWLPAAQALRGVQPVAQNPPRGRGTF
eukprot:RCo010629